jgi:hypothetical protein
MSEDPEEWRTLDHTDMPVCGVCNQRHMLVVARIHEENNEHVTMHHVDKGWMEVLVWFCEECDRLGGEGDCDS